MNVRLAHGLDAAPRATPVTAVVALGANLGARADTLAAAVDELVEAGTLEDFSGGSELDRELAQIATGSQVDEELARLKGELASGGKARELEGAPREGDKS